MVEGTFTEWLENNHGDYGLCSPPISLEEFEKFLIRYLLPEPPQIVMPMTEAQCRTEILWDILMNNSKKFGKEWRKYLKRKQENPGRPHIER